MARFAEPFAPVSSSLLAECLKVINVEHQRQRPSQRSSERSKSGFVAGPIRKVDDDILKT
jgi:hypothetical protein